MKACSNKLLIWAIVGMLFVIIGYSLHVFWPILFKKFLSKELPLTPTSRLFNLWKDTNSIPMNMDFYFFNWTNPEEFKIPGKKPILNQVGPYSFIYKAEKVNITFHPENHTISYETRKFWWFDPSKSNGTLQDKIIHLNVIAVTAAHKVRYWSYFMQNTLSYMLNKLSGIHIVRTVDELLFKGYDDPIINMGKIAIQGQNEDMPPHDRFGWFYLRNGSTFFEGHFNMETGEDDIRKKGAIKFWNYKDTTSYYKTPCNVVEGQAAEIWPPDINTNDITIFSADLCRPVTYEYIRNVTHQGIFGHHYAIGKKTLSNYTLRRYPHEQAKYFEKTTTTEDFFNAEPAIKGNESNLDQDTINMGRCYCNGECSPSGLINVTSCRYGAPGFISLPHFYKADPMLRDQVVGMNPNEKDHSFYITLEPTTGAPVDVAARFQINILVQPSKTIELFKNVPKIYFPIFWFSMKGGTTDELSYSLRQLLRLNTIGINGSIMIMVIGIVMLLIIAIMIMLKNVSSSSKNIRKVGIIDKNQKSEKLYMDLTTTNDENERTDCQLYPKEKI